MRFVGFGPVRETTFFNQKTRTPEQRAAWLQEMERIGERDARQSRARSPRTLAVA
ncbi:uncharacterized protein SOCE26_003210 [Sorangium cellulosum]|uniref:PH domain-containing protein n=1 Tax=Sorangium cellulosum TaxID=56 RepID=A0A2L0EI22_SORCE|nr:uncharacterized protein SOCE26_003210 [Sorangium cellulosum]